MACAVKKKCVDVLPGRYERKRRRFVAELKLFNENRGTPFDHVPEIAGCEVDLFHLYQRVTGFGGWQKVNDAEKWQNFQEEFGLPRACVNSVQVLKNIYFRYLNFYEKVNYLKQDPDAKNDEEDDRPVRKKKCLPVETIPLYYNYSQHKLTDAQRQHHSLSTKICNQSKYDKLTLSLCSGLPNEVDLAVSVCILLSTEGRHSMKLENSSQLLCLLLAHVGIFDENSDDMQDLYQNCWTHYTNRNFLKFWFETVNRTDIRSLLIWRGHQYVQRDFVESEVLNLGRNAGILDIEGQRVLQIAVILYNLSFEDANQKILASSHLVYKFLLLSFHSTYGGLRQLALDTLANISCELALDAFKGLNSQLVLDLLNCALFSDDRFFVVRGLEILSKLCQLACNESILLDHLRGDVYQRLVDLLTVQDIQLIVHTLEALYKLSKVGEPFTTRIAHVHRAVDTLVSLTTIKAQSFGPASLVGIKVLEYVPPAYVRGEGGDNVRRATTVIQPVNPDTVNIYQVPANSQSQFGVVPNTGGGSGRSSGVGHIQSGTTPFIKQDHVTDIYTTTSNWLNATYDLKKKSKVNQVELFSDYLQFCRNFGINKAMSSADFLHLVKVIFHECNVLSINRRNGDREVYLDGLCRRSMQQPFALAILHSEKGCILSSPLLQVTPRKNSQKNISSKMKAGQHTIVAKKVKVRPSAPSISKQTLLKTNSSGIARNIFTQTNSPTNQHQLLSCRLNSAKGQSFPPQTVEANKTNGSHLYSVKSLLAQKLSKGTPTKDFTTSPGPSSRLGSITNVTSSSTPTIVTSSHNLPSTQQQLSTQIVSSMEPTSLLPSTIFSIPSTPTSSINICETTSHNHQSSQPLKHHHQNHTNLNHASLDPFVIHASSVQQDTNQSSTIAAHKNELPLLHHQKQTVSCAHGNTAQLEQNTQVTVPHPITVTHCLSQSSNISTVAQHISTAQTSLSGVSSIILPLTQKQSSQQKTFVKLTQIMDTGHQHNIFTANDVIAPQGLSSQVILTAGRDSIRNPSSKLIAHYQIATTASTSNIITITAVTTQSTTVTQPLSSPSVTSQSTTVAYSSSSPSVTAQSTTVTQSLFLPSVTAQSTTVTQPSSSLSVTDQSTTVEYSLSSPSVTSQSTTVTQSSSSPSATVQSTTVTYSLPAPAVTAELTTCSQQGPQIKMSTPMIIVQTPTPTNHTTPVPGGVKITSTPGNITAVTSSSCISLLQQQQTLVTHHSSSTSSSNTTISSQCHPSFKSLQTPSPPTESRLVRPGFNSHDQHKIIGQTLNVSPPLVMDSHTQPQHQQAIYHSHCNGFSHDVNGILDSPESIGSDFPASPLSTGLSSDTDYPNEKFMQMENMLFKTNHIGIGGFVEESIKNGYVYPHEGNHKSVKLVCTEQQKIGAQNNGLITVSEVTVDNGCFSNVTHSSVLLDKKANILGNQGSIESPHQLEHHQPLVKQSQQQYVQMVPEEPQHVQMVPEKPQHVQMVPEEPQHVQMVPEKPQNVQMVPEEPQHVQMVPEELQHVQIVPEEPQHVQMVPEEPQHVQMVPEEPQQHVQMVPEEPQKQIMLQSQHLQKHTNLQQFIQHGLKHPQPQYSSSWQQLSHVQHPLSGHLQQSTQLCPRIISSISSKNIEPQRHLSLGTTSNKLSGNNNFTSTLAAERIHQNAQSLHTQINYKRKSKEMKLDAKSLSPQDTIPQSANSISTEETFQRQSITQKSVKATMEYICEWDNCRRCFSSAQLVFLHVYKQHLPRSAESSCQWASCPKLVRKRWSLVSHIQNHHCSEKAMQVVCPTQQQKSGTATASGPASTSHSPVTYSSEAAVKAVGCLSVRRPYPELTDEREGPVSKHIHLMAALILRNICHFSSLGRRLIKRHEQELSYNTMSAVEASSALSQCLWEITQFCDQSPLIS